MLAATLSHSSTPPIDQSTSGLPMDAVAVAGPAPDRNRIRGRRIKSARSSAVDGGGEERSPIGGSARDGLQSPRGEFRPAGRSLPKFPANAATLALLHLTHRPLFLSRRRAEVAEGYASKIDLRRKVRTGPGRIPFPRSPSHLVPFLPCVCGFSSICVSLVSNCTIFI